MVEATLNYMAPMAEKPVYYRSTPRPGVPWRNTKGDRRTLPIHDAREEDASLDEQGFALVRHETRVDDFLDDEQVNRLYYPEVEALVREHTGADRVLVFDHNVRNAAHVQVGVEGVQDPVRYVHNDYTDWSGPQRVRDLAGDEAEALLQGRAAVINVWKPIVGPVQATPLAFCDARSIGEGELVATDLLYEDRRGEVYSMLYAQGHKWWSYPAMQPNEVLLLKCWDSARDRARYTAHTAFDDPRTPADAPARESVEIRTLAFFGG